MDSRKKLPAVAACAALLLLAIAPATATAKFRAIRAVITISGQTSGDQMVKLQVPPQNSSCPPQVTQEHEKATVTWRAVFKQAVVPLQRSGPVLKSAPRGSGGPTGGTFSYDGTYLKDDPSNQDACPTLASASASAKLSRQPLPRPSWTDREVSGEDVFYVGYVGSDPGDIAGNPKQLLVPQDEWDGTPDGLVPIDVRNGLPLEDVLPQRGLPLQGLTSSVLFDWNALQGRLRALAHRRSVTLKISSHLDNSQKPARFTAQCPGIGPPSGGTGGYGLLSCTETMDLSYTVTIRKTGPAHACDVSAKHCLT